MVRTQPFQRIDLRWQSCSDILFDNPIIKSAPFGNVGVVICKGVVNKVVQLLREHFFSLSKPQKILVYMEYIDILINFYSKSFMIQWSNAKSPKYNPIHNISQSKILLRINPKQNTTPSLFWKGRGFLITSPLFFWQPTNKRFSN